MKHLIIHEKPVLREPDLLVAFSGWSDAGQGATGAIKYLAEELSATRFGELDPEEFYDFTDNRPSVRSTEDGRLITWPANDFYYLKDKRWARDLLLVSGIEPNLKWKTYCNEIVELAHDLKVHSVIMLGGLLSGSPHTREPRLTGLSNRADIQTGLESVGTRSSSYQGPTGIGSALWDRCTKRDIPYTSIWGHSPHYLQSSPNPMVTLALLSKVSDLLGIDVDLEPLRSASNAFEEEVAKAVGNDPELSSYVQRLEEEYDKQEMDRFHPQPDIPSADVLVQDLEEFLRKKQEQDKLGGEPQ